MNKIMIYTIAFIISYSVKGQYLKNDFSINFSPAMSTIYGRLDQNDSKPRMTFSAGVTYSYSFSENTFLQTGLLFERKGAKMDIDIFDSNGNYYQDIEYIFDRDYFTVPVNCLFTTNSKLKFYYGGGLYFSYLIGSKNSKSKVSTKETFANETKQFDLGINLGFGIFIPINSKLIIDIGLKDNLGLRNTMTMNVERNNVIGLQIGLKQKF